jgi:hypothetical protein
MAGHGRLRHPRRGVVADLSDRWALFARHRDGHAAIGAEGPPTRPGPAHRCTVRQLREPVSNPLSRDRALPAAGLMAAAEIGSTKLGMRWRIQRASWAMPVEAWGTEVRPPSLRGAVSPDAPVAGDAASGTSHGQGNDGAGIPARTHRGRMQGAWRRRAWDRDPPRHHGRDADGRRGRLPRAARTMGGGAMTARRGYAAVRSTSRAASGTGAGGPTGSGSSASWGRCAARHARGHDPRAGRTRAAPAHRD